MFARKILIGVMGIMLSAPAVLPILLRGRNAGPRGSTSASNGGRTHQAQAEAGRNHQGGKPTG
jgi:hypothetical protein